jgi:hypothetical protein
LPDWPERLAACVAANMARPYEPAQHDCLLWPATAVEAVTGVDLGLKHRGKYDSTAKAYRYLQRLGFDSPAALLDSLFEQKAAGFAQRGDLVLTEDGIPGLCMGAFALAPGETDGAVGLVRKPRAMFVKAWKVGA